MADGDEGEASLRVRGAEEASTGNVSLRRPTRSSHAREDFFDDA